jgi:hypothetical protein
MRRSSRYTPPSAVFYRNETVDDKSRRRLDSRDRITALRTVLPRSSATAPARVRGSRRNHVSVWDDSPYNMGESALGGCTRIASYYCRVGRIRVDIRVCGTMRILRLGRFLNRH